ncbi:MAG: hypothetical protein FWF65_05225 [Bacteroidetes bacterium]|nr:hypothetical protein [Bacteroidota bacterium]
MKKVLIIILISCNWALYSQELILSENVKQYYKLLEDINGPSTFMRRNVTDLDELTKKLEKYDSLFKIRDIDVSSHYVGYADLLAKLGKLEKSIEYYEKAFALNKMSAKAFEQRKEYFEKDTLLYNQKRKELNEKYVHHYSAREIELLIEVKEIFAMDQFARYYNTDYPKHKDCSKNILEYVDSITMIKLVDLLEKYPEYTNPLTIDPFAPWVIGRHIFTAYPEFWLTYFEPKERDALLKGNGLIPTEYARTYDRCMITSGRSKYSYYGEWDDEGKAANPDKDLVNKHRTNLGLPILEERKNTPSEFFITY